MAKRRFEFSAGSLALDFVDTLAAREAESEDLLDTPDRLLEWLQAADIGFASSRPLNSKALSRARLLREAIYRLVIAILKQKTLPPNDLDRVNQHAARPDLRPQLIDGVLQYRATSRISAALSTIAADAVRLLDASNHRKLRQCPDCRMLFRDNSRPQNRIWCSSASGCGNRAKVRRHRASRNLKQV